MLPSYWQDAVAALSEHDRILKELIHRHPDISLKSRGDAFSTLARSIVGQQISVKASESVWQKLLVVVPDVAPAILVQMEETALRECGLSQRKAGCRAVGRRWMMKR
jgi:DNA-3-methyladenine glycosylase II